jgi:hypothetical protein
MNDIIHAKMARICSPVAQVAKPALSQASKPAGHHPTRLIGN